MYSDQEQPPPTQPPAYMPPTQRVKFEFIGEAFQLLQKQLGAWVGAATLTVLLTSLFISPIYIYWILQLTKNPEQTNPTVSGLLSIVVTLVSTIMGAGLQYMALKQLRGETLSATSFTGAFSKFGPLAILGLFLGAVSALFGVLPGFLPLLLIVPEILLTTFFTLSSLLILDRNLEPVAALKESVRVMRQEFWISLAFILLSGMASMVGFAACGLGVLFSLPLYPLCIVLLYRAFYPERFSPTATQEGQ